MFTIKNEYIYYFCQLSKNKNSSKLQFCKDLNRPVSESFVIGNKHIDEIKQNTIII